MTRRRKKLLDTQLRKKNKDRISELPDSLIQHVLSFAPTKCAVSTTVLSKRWMDLWMHVPTLDLSFSKGEDSDEEYLNEEETNRYMDFVDRLLTLRNKSTILKFRLLCYNNYFDNNRVMEWIETAVKCKVEEVILSMTFRESEIDMFPSSLFTSDSLIKLEIDFKDSDIICILYRPQSISFPRLKILLLSCVTFQDEMLVQQLFSNCPLLEDLCLTDCNWDEINLISISAPALKSFTLINSEWGGGIDSAELKIDAPNLMSIRYLDYLPLNLVVDNFPSLVDADLCFLNDFDGIYDFGLLSKFMMKLSNVDHLQFSTLFINTEILGLVNVLSASVPTFENLIHLETGYIRANTMIKFLQFTPNLESLAIIQAKVDEDAFTSNIVPRCLLRHLKKIKVQMFEGLSKELQLVKYFLKNARVLRVLIIESGITSKSVAELKKRTRVMQRLLMFPRASKSCKVKFQFPE